jgi:aspartate/methionine/tyrosine aminotransferase
MRKSRLPEGGENLFDLIREWIREAEKAGRPIIRLSIGQPTGPALKSARLAASEAVMSLEEAMHEYQERVCSAVPGFPQRFAHFHVRRSLSGEDVAYIPTVGTKSSLEHVIRACGGIATVATLKRVAMMTAPGYPTPRVQCAYQGIPVQELPLNPLNSFRFSPTDIWSDVGLVMCNFPHNPSGQIATRQFWQDLCAHCVKYDMRLFNDEAYIALSHIDESCSLADVAPDFPDLSWAAAYSASKLTENATGWRVGAMVGSPDFIQDVATIAGNSDSGFNAALATGVINAVEHDRAGIARHRRGYARRLPLLINGLTDCGMQLAEEPVAGFFALWRTPQRAFGQEIRNAAHFNRLVIENTGVVGVHFDPSGQSDPSYYRTAVVGPIERWLPQIGDAFDQARVSYN